MEKLITFLFFPARRLHLCESILVRERRVVSSIKCCTVFSFHLSLVIVLINEGIFLFATSRNQKQDCLSFVITYAKWKIQMHPKSSVYRLLSSTEDPSRRIKPMPTIPMTTPKTMSHVGVAGSTGEAKVGTMPRNSRVLSLSRKALLMRFLDFLMTTSLDKCKNMDDIQANMSLSQFKFCKMY